MAGEDQWTAYIRLVPEEIRKDIARELVNIDLDGYQAVIQVSKNILGRVLSGELPPAIADAAHKYVKLILTTMSAENAMRLAQSNDAMDPNAEALRLLAIAAKDLASAPKQIAKSFDTAYADRDVVDAREVILIKKESQ